MIYRLAKTLQIICLLLLFQEDKRRKKYGTSTQTQPEGTQTDKYTNCKRGVFRGHHGQTRALRPMSNQLIPFIVSQRDQTVQQHFKNHPSPKITAIATNTSDNRLFISTDDHCPHWGLTQNTLRVSTEVLMHADTTLHLQVEGKGPKWQPLTITNFKTG